MTEQPRAALAVAPEIFFRSRIAATAGEVGADLRTASTIPELEEQLNAGGIGLVMINLETNELDPLAAIRASTRFPEVRTIAFVSHVDEELQAAARQAGCPEVMSKGEFTRKLPELLREV